MTNPPKKFKDGIPPADQSLYSLNFLLAAFTPLAELERDEQFLENRLPSRHYQNWDFSVVRFCKHISTPLNQFVPVSGDDE